MTGPDDLARGQERLAAGDWAGAQQAFEAALAASAEDPVALAGLGEARFWLGEPGEAIELRRRAYVGFRDRGDRAAAARLALWLAAEHDAALGNAAAGAGWLARAERLIGELGDCGERGWLLLRRARSGGDPAAAEALAREALAIAHRHGDRDLEIAAISQEGRALLAGGRTELGFARLDEAMAAATGGEATHAATVSDTCCDMIVACERAMAFERATQWCAVTDEYARRYRFQPLFAFCRVTYAAVLIALGRWAEADRELAAALRSYEAALPAKAVLALARLAELRLLQGRDAEAEELLAEHAQSPVAARAMAMLHLARGDAAEAAHVLARRLAAVEHDLLLAAPLHALLVEARLAAGEPADAAAAAARLRAIATTTRCAAFAAAAAFAEAQVACRRDAMEAVDGFLAAIDGFAAIGMPFLAARARVGLARCLVDHDPRTARDACRAAIASFEELGARRELDAAAELRRRLGVGAHVGPRRVAALTRREAEVLDLLGLGLPNAAIGARLFISPKTVEHHVSHILDKLGVATRAAAAAYAAKSPPRKPDAK